LQDQHPDRNKANVSTRPFENRHNPFKSKGIAHVNPRGRIPRNTLIAAISIERDPLEFSDVHPAATCVVFPLSPS
jgi:hypothetical protein